MTDAKSKSRSSTINELVGGSEPNWKTDKKPLNFIRAINWYSNQKSYKESKQYLISYMKELKYSKSDITSVSKVDENVIKNIGFICRIRQQGGEVEMKHISLISEKIDYFIRLGNSEEKPEEIISQVYIAPKIEEPKVDKTFLESTNYINEIEGVIDEFITSKNPITFKPYEYFIASSVKGVHAKQIISYYSPVLEELTEALSGKNKEISEAYSIYKKVDLKKYVEFISIVISDAEKIINNTKISKPRKKKAISSDKKVSKLIFKKEDTTFKIKSINPVDILGCSQLWVFNTKTKKLGVYVSKSESGLAVKGSSILDFDEDLSIHKTLRKPLEVLPNVIKGSKIALKKLLPSINSVESKLNGRINQETILLKIIK